jgi:hypothetical protein
VTQSLVEALMALPPTPSITYRGTSGPAANASFTLQAVLPTSADPRVASENFTSEALAAIVTITGRDIAPLSRYPDDREIALLPGTLLRPVGSIDVDGLTNAVVLLAELGTAPGLPRNYEELRDAVRGQVGEALRLPPVIINSPGRYAPQLA